MRRKNKIAAIDVGTTKVCTVMANWDDENQLRIVGFGVAPSQGLEKALVSNINLARESIQQSIRKAEQMAGYKLGSASVGVTGRHVASSNNHGSIAITRNDQVVRSDDLQRVMDVALNIRAPGDRRMLHSIPRSYVLDGQEVRNPVGMHGYELNVEAHVITASVVSVKNLSKCIMSLGINVENLILEPLASAEAILTDEERERGVMVADIGGGTTDIAVIRDGSIYHSSVLPVAGQQVTHDISIGLGLSFELAEEMKKRYGSVLPGSGTEGDDLPVSDDGHSISSRDLSDIVYARIEELIRLIVLELPRNDYARLIPAGIVLTGGTANLPGIAGLASEITKLPVRLGTPLMIPGVAGESLDNTAYATCVGLLLWAIRHQNLQQWVPQHRGLSRLFSPVMRIFR
jgi:cell division protein FtsA